MKTIKVKNTYQLKLQGAPSLGIREKETPSHVAVSPSAIPLIKPKLLIKEGDAVKIGTPLFFDKNHPEVFFVSPGSGRVESIQFGEKRRLDQIKIALDKEEAYESLPVMSSDEIDNCEREKLIEALLKSGMWPIFKEQPFNRIPSPTKTPPAIYVSLDKDEPFLPQSEVYIKGNEDAFRVGIQALSCLSKKVVVAVSTRNTALKESLAGIITHEVSGYYPANDARVVLYYDKASQDENAAWTVDGQDVIRLGALLSTGKYPVHRMVTVAGAALKHASHVWTREGVSVSYLLQDEPVSEPTRYIAGGVLTGRQITQDGYLGLYDFALNLVREGKEPEMFTFFRPGFDKPTYSKTYLSALLRNFFFKPTTSLNGGDRACISCGLCPNVCPVGLYPQLIMKNLYAGDTEEAVKLGLLDCTGCGLCTYVCPSKINLDNVLNTAKEKLARDAQ